MKLQCLKLLKLKVVVEEKAQGDHEVVDGRKKEGEEVLKSKGLGTRRVCFVI
jgi:hypothetical protein